MSPFAPRRWPRSLWLIVVGAVAALVGAVAASVLMGPQLTKPRRELGFELPPAAFRPLPDVLGNAGFEDGVDPDGGPVGWGGGGPGYRRTVDATVASSGRSSARVERTSGSSDDFGTVATCVPGSALAAGVVRYSGFLRSEGAAAGGLWMRVDGTTIFGRPKTLAFDNMDDRPVRGTTGWQRYEIQLPIPKGAKRTCLGFLLIGNGTLWADDLTLEHAWAVTE